MKLSECRRVLLVSYEPETAQILIRHYFINIKIAGVSKSVKHIQSNSDIPDLRKFDDISEFFLREAFASESDVEEGGENVVELSNQSLGRRKAKTAPAARAIRLTELGPRLTLSLTKIEDGFCGGEVIYHRHVKLSADEQAAKKAEWEKREQERQLRRSEQESNVERKTREKEEHKLRCGGKSASPETLVDVGDENNYSSDEEDENVMDNYADDTSDDDAAEDSEEQSSADGDAADDRIQNKRARK
jgi:ribosome biogenesis protein SSF1/2